MPRTRPPLRDRGRRRAPANIDPDKPPGTGNPWVWRLPEAEGLTGDVGAWAHPIPDANITLVYTNPRKHHQLLLPRRHLWPRCVRPENHRKKQRRDEQNPTPNANSFAKAPESCSVAPGDRAHPAWDASLLLSQGWGGEAAPEKGKETRPKRMGLEREGTSAVDGLAPAGLTAASCRGHARQFSAVIKIG